MVLGALDCVARASLALRAVPDRAGCVLDALDVLSMLMKRDPTSAYVRFRTAPRCSFFPSVAVGTLAFLFVLVASIVLLSWVGTMLNEHGFSTFESHLTLPFLLILYTGIWILSAFVGEHKYSSMRWKVTRADIPQCLKCGYNLTGNMSGTCPECGTPVPDEVRKELAADSVGRAA